MRSEVGSQLSNRIRRYGERLGFADFATYVFSDRSSTGYASESYLRELANDPHKMISDEYRQEIEAGMLRVDGDGIPEDDDVPSDDDDPGVDDDDDYSSFASPDSSNSEDVDDDLVRIADVTIEITFTDGLVLKGSPAKVYEILRLAQRAGSAVPSSY